MSDLKIINDRINSEYCEEIAKALSDENLLGHYKNANSVKNQVKILSDVLDKNLIEEKIKESIINDYFAQLIPPGTKGVIRGIRFNILVKEYILSQNLGSDKFEIAFEKDCPGYKSSEKPDWFILEKSTKKALIGMNQLDLWGGGQQSNRGNKYINLQNQEGSKLICVVCNKTSIKSDKTKVYELFKKGYANNNLCYIKGLSKIIREYFGLVVN